jgi:hypothetical protein
MGVEANAKPLSVIIAETTEQARAAEGNLQQLIEKSSVDPFGSATRSHIDKLILASLIGVLLATVGHIDPSVHLGPFTIDVKVVKFIPAFITVAIVFYGASLLSLAIADIRKWRATYRLSVATMRPLIRNILAAMAENQRIFSDQGAFFREMMANGEEFGEADEDGIPLIVKEAAREANERSEGMKGELQKLLRPAVRMKTQFTIALSIFVIMPLIFGGLSICLLIYSALHSST